MESGLLLIQAMLPVVELSEIDSLPIRQLLQSHIPPASQ
jgi:hypothetical protein